MSPTATLIANLRADALASNRRTEIVLLDAARANVRTACTIWDARRRNAALRKIATDLARAWLDAECREDAATLQRAIDDVVLRAAPIADLQRLVRA